LESSSAGRSPARGRETFIDIYSKAVCARLYDHKTLVTPASLLNSCCRCSQHEVKLLCVLTDLL